MLPVAAQSPPPIYMLSKAPQGTVKMGYQDETVKMESQEDSERGVTGLQGSPGPQGIQVDG